MTPRVASILYLLLLLAAPLTAQVTQSARLGPEHLLPEPSLGDELFPSNLHAIVSDGEGYLVFWTRTDFATPLTPIHVTRVNALGQPIDDPIELIGGRERVWGLRAASLPTGGWVVVWNDTEGLWVQLFDARLQPRWVMPARLSKTGVATQVACNPRMCLIVEPRQSGLVGIAVEASGQLTADVALLPPAQQFSLTETADGFVIGTIGEYPNYRVGVAAFDDSLRPRRESMIELGGGTIGAAPNGFGAMLTWTQGQEIRAAIVDGEGRTSIPKRVGFLDTTSGHAITDVVSTQSQHLVLMNRVTRPGGVVIGGAVSPFDVYGLRLTMALDPLDPAPFPIRTEPHANLSPVGASNGRDYLIGWNYTNVLAPTLFQGRFLLMRPEGTVGQMVSLRVGPRPQGGSALATNGVGHLAVWQEPTTGAENRLLATVVAPSGENAPPLHLADGELRTISAASDGRDYAVAWTDRGSHFAIVDGAQCSLRRAVTLDGAIASAVVWTGTTYALLVREGASINLARIASDGTLLESAPLFTASSVRATALAADDGFVVAAWSVIGSGTFVATYNDRQEVKQVSTRVASALALAAHDDEAFLVASEHDRAGVTATRIAADGTKLDGGPQDLGLTIDPRLTHFPVSAIRFRDSWLALWRRTTDSAVYGQRFGEGSPFRVEPSGYIAHQFGQSIGSDGVTILFRRATRLVLRELIEEGGVPRRRTAR